MYTMRLGLRPWKLNPFYQIASVSILAFMILIATFLGWFAYELKPILRQLEITQVFSIFVQQDATEGIENQISSEAREILNNYNLNPNTELEIKVLDRVAFLAELGQTYPDLSKELAGLGLERDAVVPRTVTVLGSFSTKKLSEVIEKLKEISGVESVEASKDKYINLVGAFRVLRKLLIVLLISMLVAIMSTIIHLSTAHSRIQRPARELLRQWGASTVQSSLPGVISAFGICILAALISAGIWVSRGGWIVTQIIHLSPYLEKIPKPVAGLLSSMHWIMLFLVFGFILGMTSYLFTTEGRE